MNKVITTFQLTVTTLSGMIGVGWLFGSFVGATTAGYASILGWIIAGMLASMIAMIFTEITIAIPVTGSYLRYPYITHGELSAFIMNWMPWLSCVMAAPTEVNATLAYSHHFLPWLMANGSLTNSGLCLAMLLLVIFTYLNSLSIQILLNYSKYLTFWKVTVPLVTLLFLTVYGKSYNPDIVISSISWPSIFEFTSGMCLFSFLGFLEATTLAGEIKNPEKSIPTAIIGSIVFCTFLYVLMQWVFIANIPISWVQNGLSNLSFDEASGPFAALATQLGLTHLAFLIYLDAIITPTGTAMMYIASTSRMVMAMSENSYLPKGFLKLNKYHMPKNALIFNSLVGLMLLFSLSDFNKLIKIQSSAMMLAYSMGPCSFLALRSKLPHLHRPFYVPFGKFLSWLVFTVCNTMLYCSGWSVNSNLFLVLTIGAIAFLSHKANKDLFLNWKRNGWLISHCLCLALISYTGNYDGGLNIFTHCTDYILIAIESFLILKWSIKSSQNSEEIAKFIALT